MNDIKEILINDWIGNQDKNLIKKVLKYVSKKEFYDICKSLYRRTNDKFFIDSMKSLNLYYYLNSYYFLYKEKKSNLKSQQIVKSKSAQLDKLINSIATPQNCVYIMQYSFYDPKGVNYFSGGGERYARDLADLIKNLGYKPILLQKGMENDSEPWVRNMNDLVIIGVNSGDKEYYKIINSIESPKLTIYSGCISWSESKTQHPSVLISHGITWDSPNCDTNIKSLRKMLNIADTFVSVDTNTISWYRSTFAKSIHDSNLRMKYIPNYADTEKYTPRDIANNENSNIKIIFPRRCSEERGFWLFADIIPDLLLKYENITIDLIGYAHTKKIENKIDLLKEKFPSRFSHYVCDQDKMHEVYKNADITIIPTLYSEGTSLSCIEAMASGNAVISTYIGGLPNLIIDGYNGLLIEPDKDSLLCAIIKLIENRDLRFKLSKNAINVASEFSKKQWVYRWEQILNKYL